MLVRILRNEGVERNQPHRTILCTQGKRAMISLGAKRHAPDFLYSVSFLYATSLPLIA